MKVLVIALLYLASFIAGAKTTSPAEQKNEPWNDTRLENYQDAWRAINQYPNVTYYLLRATYNNDSVWGENFTCVNVRVVSTNETYKSVTYNTSYRNGLSSATHTLNETVQAVTLEGHSVPTVIQWTLPDKSTLNDTVVFSDGLTCDVLNIPYKDDGYELWVRSEYLGNPPMCCQFLFDLFTLGRTIYNISSYDLCKDELTTTAAPVAQASAR